MPGALGSENDSMANVEYVVVRVEAFSIWFVKWVRVEFNGVAREHDYRRAFEPSAGILFCGCVP